MEFTVNQIAAILGGSVEGNGDLSITTVAKIEEAGPNALAFLSNPKYEKHIYSTKAGVVLVSNIFTPEKPIKVTLIRVEDPYLSFTSLLEEYARMLSFQKEGIEEPAYISSSATIGEQTYRGAFSYIGKNCKIGSNTKIYPQAYIGDNCVIGDNTIVYPGVKIYENTVIGNECVLHAGAVIGSDGFGFAPKDDGTYKTIPQLGNVLIADNVSIGANTVIDCATFPGDSTSVASGSKIDNLIQVAHNVKVGKNTVIAAQAGISGSTTIGNNCVIAGQVGIVGHIKIGNKTTIAAQAGVSKSILKEGQVLIGSPGFPIKNYMKSYAVFKNLPDVLQRIKRLEEKDINLPAE